MPSQAKPDSPRALAALRRRVRIGAVLLASAACLARGGRTPGPPAEPAATFEQRVKEYENLREQAVKRAGELPKGQADAARLAERQQDLAFEIRVARADAERGAIFDAETSRAITSLIAREMDSETRHAIVSGNPRVEEAPAPSEKAPEKPTPVKLDVNAPYPPEAPLSTVPPNLLALLPSLPKSLEYRFVGPHLILEDPEARLIVDYILNAAGEPMASAPPPAPPSPGPSGRAKPVAPLPRSLGIVLPRLEDSLRFAVLGDSGSATSAQYEVGRRMAEARARFPFEFVVMLGDNLYGSQRAADFVQKFEKPYQALLSAGVKFYASLGNHDDPAQVNYKHFNMGGKRFYSYRPKEDVCFFALDSNYLDKEQLAWLQKELRGSTAKWKICFFHHPLYSSGRKHGGLEAAREVLEPLFTENGVDVVFSGHEHFYERLKPQQGVHYFISGAAGKLREADIRQQSPVSARGFDTDLSFMLVEIAGDGMYFQVLSRSGRTVDGGVIRRSDATAGTLPDRAPARQAEPAR
jgi:hypothetical protein